ncbi:MAG: PilZ domain-containing protein [Sedimentisphaerales bacterium]|nr:PilZ domain-containing protein [Sedimentisphaerales bacterium]
MVWSVEQRRSQRRQTEWPVSVWHPRMGRFIHGRSVNVSEHGALLEVGPRTPVEAGQEVEVNFPREKELASEAGQSARIKSGKVVRVDRSVLMGGAAVRVGIEFGRGESVEE